MNCDLKEYNDFKKYFETLGHKEQEYMIARLIEIKDSCVINNFNFVHICTRENDGDISEKIMRETGFECRYKCYKPGTIGTNIVYVPVEVFSPVLKYDLEITYDSFIKEEMKETEELLKLKNIFIVTPKELQNEAIYHVGRDRARWKTFNDAGISNQRKIVEYILEKTSK